MNVYPSQLALPATILIVENEFLIANNLRYILENAGYQVLGLAESATEARLMVAAQPPSIVLLDIFLEGEETGIELAPWLSARHIPFVYLSANLSDNVLEAAKVTQPFGFLNKPFREKDVLTTLEIARYRHAHSEEAQLRQQQQMQMAVNNAIITITDRNQLCQAIAVQINHLVPFSLFNLRIGLPEEEQFYWVMLEKTATGAFERIYLPDLLGDVVSDPLLEEIAREAPAQVDEYPGIITGPAFDSLCSRRHTVRASRDNFGIRAVALFPVLLKRQSFTNIHLASTDPDGFTPQDYAAVELILPQIALALENLLACEEIDARRRLKTAELAVVSAFQNGRHSTDIAPQVAMAINELLPIDLLSIYRLGRVLGESLFDMPVHKEDGVFVPLPEAMLASLPTTAQLDWQQALTTIEPWLMQPTLNVGERAVEARNRNMVAKHYSEVLDLKSSMFVPILMKGEPAASLIVASKAPYAFTGKDLAMLQELSSQVALALENMLSFERIKLLSKQLNQEKTYLSEELKTNNNFEEIIGTSPALQALQKSIDRAAPTCTPVLIMGEIGTGKELIARAIHSLSPRKVRTMIKVDCAALPVQALEAELFGGEGEHVSGAFDQRIGKYELANGSTLFLDEIGQLPLALQAKLLHSLHDNERERQDGHVPIAFDVRIIASTKRNLQQDVLVGRFRADLYQCLTGFSIAVPPLRERPEDILPLAMHFLHKISQKQNRPLIGLGKSSGQQLLGYAWPGNIQELKHVLERLAILSPGSTLELTEPLLSGHLPQQLTLVSSSTGVQPLHDTMREAILAALVQANNRIRGQGGAAELLHVKPTTLEARMKKLHITLPK